MRSSDREPSAFLPPDDEKLSFEHGLAAEGFSPVAGIDEAGRGCCAGPVVAAAVVFTDPARIPAGVDDSKRLTPKHRMELRARLLAEPSVKWAVAEIAAEEIDRTDILRATWKAMRLALMGVTPPAVFAIVDGNPVKGLELPSRNIVKGDAKSASIAAASILAKTHRDLWMERAAKMYPDYAFEVHKGYCTALHTERLRRFGPCPIHRLTFEPVKIIVHPPDLIQDSLF